MTPTTPDDPTPPNAEEEALARLAASPHIHEIQPGDDAPLQPETFRALHVWETVDTNDGTEITRCCACSTLFDSPEANYHCPAAPEHPHAGRIAAVAHLSAAYARAMCAEQALDDLQTHGDDYAEQLLALGQAFEAAADAIVEPCGIANVLQAVEEVAAGETADLTNVHVTHRGREQIIRAMIDVAASAHREVSDIENETRTCCDTAPDERHHHECSEAEPTDDEIYNRPGMEGGIPYTEPNPANYREDDA